MYNNKLGTNTYMNKYYTYLYFKNPEKQGKMQTLEIKILRML